MKHMKDAAVKNLIYYGEARTTFYNFGKSDVKPEDQTNISMLIRFYGTPTDALDKRKMLYWGTSTNEISTFAKRFESCFVSPCVKQPYARHQIEKYGRISQKAVIRFRPQLSLDTLQPLYHARQASRDVSEIKVARHETKAFFVNPDWKNMNSTF